MLGDNEEESTVQQQSSPIDTQLRTSLNNEMCGASAPSSHDVSTPVIIV